MAEIREFTATDMESVVDLSLRAWAPVFASMQAVLKPEIYDRMHPDWRADQRRDVEEACANAEHRTWVAEADGKVVGFVVISFHARDKLGEIYMIAVDPDYHRQGTASALIEFALDQMRGAGMTIAMIETGDDPGHAPARRTYENVGFQILPVARYFKAL
jgi:ribosomal protein S18 acetylase RimI-like enzyme